MDKSLSLKNLLLSVVLVAVVSLSSLSLSSCKISKDIRSITFKKVNIGDAKMLALTNGENSKNASIVSLLYKVDDDGSIEDVTYVIEVACEDDSVINIINRTLKLNISKVIPVGDKWVWLYDCTYVCPSLDDIDDEEIRDEIQRILNIDNTPRNYLVRISDGTIFEWTQNAGCPTNIWMSSQNLPDPLVIRGVVEPYRDDILTISNSGVIVHLRDKGDALVATTLTPATAHAKMILPTNENFIGARISYDEVYNPEGDAFVVLLDEARVLPINIPLPEDFFLADTIQAAYGITVLNHGYKNPFLISINGKLYYVRGGVGLRNGDFSYLAVFGRVSVGDGIVSQDLETEFTILYGGVNTSLRNIPVLPFDDCVYSETEIVYIARVDNPKAYYFSFIDPELNIYGLPVPEHFPLDMNQYSDGVAFSINNDDGQVLPSSYWRCKIGEDRAREIPIVWGDDIQPYMSQMVMSTFNFHADPYSRSLYGYCMLLDGRKLSFFADAEGEERGVVHILLTGEQTAGAVVATMIRIN